MRITNNMINSNVLRNATKNLLAQNSVYNQITSGKKFQVPSDNPILVARTLKITSQIAENEQFKRNIEDGYSVLDKTETSLNELNTLMSRMREITVDAANGSKGEDDTKKVKAEMEQLRDQIIKLSNDTYMGRRIFNGYQSDKDVFKSDGTLNMDTFTETLDINGKPIELKDKDGNIVKDKNGNPVKSKADYYNNVLKNQTITYQVGITTNINVNITADSVFGPVDSNGKPSIINDINKIIEHLDSGDSEAISKDLDVIDKYVNGGDIRYKDTDGNEQTRKIPGLLQLRADVGAQTNTVEMIKARIEDTGLNMTKLLSETEDTDMQESYILMKSLESVYQASLSVGAKIIQPTLVDFLR